MARPTEITLVATMMDPECSDDAKALAKEIIEALDSARTQREGWLVSCRTLRDGPVVSIGPFSTKNQAMKATGRIPFADNPNTTPGLGWMVHKLSPVSWLDR